MEFQVVVDASDTVANLKGKIQTLTRIPPDQQRLECEDGTILVDAHAVSDYNLEGLEEGSFGSFVNLSHVEPEPGPGPKRSRLAA